MRSFWAQDSSPESSSEEREELELEGLLRTTVRCSLLGPEFRMSLIVGASGAPGNRNRRRWNLIGRLITSGHGSQHSDSSLLSTNPAPKKWFRNQKSTINTSNPCIIHTSHKASAVPCRGVQGGSLWFWSWGSSEGLAHLPAERPWGTGNVTHCFIYRALYTTKRLSVRAH